MRFRVGISWVNFFSYWIMPLMTPGNCTRDHELFCSSSGEVLAWAALSSRASLVVGFARGGDPTEMTQWEGRKARMWPWGSSCTYSMHCTFISVECCSWDLLSHLPRRQRAWAAFQTSFSQLLWMSLPAECNGNLSFVASYQNINPLGDALINSYSCQTCLAWGKRNCEELLGVADGPPEIWILQPIEKKE